MSKTENGGAKTSFTLMYTLKFINKTLT